MAIGICQHASIRTRVARACGERLRLRCRVRGVFEFENPFFQLRQRSEKAAVGLRRLAGAEQLILCLTRRGCSQCDARALDKCGKFCKPVHRTPLQISRGKQHKEPNARDGSSHYQHQAIIALQHFFHRVHLGQALCADNGFDDFEPRRHCLGVARGKSLGFLAIALQRKLRDMELFLKLQVGAQRLIRSAGCFRCRFSRSCPGGREEGCKCDETKRPQQSGRNLSGVHTTMSRLRRPCGVVNIIEAHRV